MGQAFSVFTDNNPITYVLTSAKLDATGHRWIEALSAFNCTITYKPSKSNADVDGLSRLPEVLDEDTVRAICNLQYSCPLIETLPVTTITRDQIHPTYAEPCQRIDLHEVQQQDSSISTWKEYVERGKRKRKILFVLTMIRSCRNVQKFRIVEDLLVRVTTYDSREHQQVLVPSNVVVTILKFLHNEMCNPGSDRTIALVMDRFYWPRMRYDIAQWVDNCDRCIRFKTPDTQRTSLVSIYFSAIATRMHGLFDFGTI